MSHVFLSYSNSDLKPAQRLAQICNDRGWPVWWDRRIVTGQTFAREIETALDSAQCVVVLWSCDSVNSNWVNAEAAEGASQQILLPALIEDVRIPLEFRRLQTADLCGWEGDPEHQGLGVLLTGIERFMTARSETDEEESVARAVESVESQTVESTDESRADIYMGGVSFSINKFFGSLQLIPETTGLRLHYVPVIDGKSNPEAPGFINLLLPLDAVGGIWATSRAFLYAVESLDENVILQAGYDNRPTETLIKLYRDKPRGENGRLSGEETCWIRVVNGTEEHDVRRLKLGPRDLLCIELACTAVLNLAATSGTHQPRPYRVSDEQRPT